MKWFIPLFIRGLSVSDYKPHFLNSFALIILQQYGFILLIHSH